MTFTVSCKPNVHLKISRSEYEDRLVATPIYLGAYILTYAIDLLLDSDFQCAAEKSCYHCEQVREEASPGGGRKCGQSGRRKNSWNCRRNYGYSGSDRKIAFHTYSHQILTRAELSKLKAIPQAVLMLKLRRDTPSTIH
jgi:hypothetical protein